MPQANAIRRVLVVEDEPLIMMLLEDKLQDLGCELLSGVTLREALALATTDALDYAILDVKLGEDDVFPVAEVLTRRNVRFMLSSGYGRDALQAEYRDHLVLEKPFTSDQLEAAVTKAFHR